MAMAGAGEDAGSSVTVATTPPEITKITLDPKELTLNPGVVTTGTLTVEVFCPNSVEWIKSAELTKVEPEMGIPMPIALKLIEVDKEGINAKYQLVVELPCHVPAGEYTLTVTVTDKSDNTVTGTASATVLETLAFSVTDVEFGTVAPGKSSEASSTVTYLGNVRFKFDKKDGIVPSNMNSGASGTIEAQNIETRWDWNTVIARGFFTPKDSVKTVPFTLNVPFGTAPGTYMGTIVFTPTPVK
ncbi:MAG: hypothetical protein BA874_02945 [Desulfuromonadales bacterium C00003068]|nr:MAG: hypothetical protein BA874_02945 [Desulfuromonadales bacterium C00003068]